VSARALASRLCLVCSGGLTMQSTSEISAVHGILNGATKQYMHSGAVNEETSTCLIGCYGKASSHLNPAQEWHAATR
ncbi:hypothetical protein HAX54_040032, partial [Datura stramonium]|nr:hypothetical protein [Datura stramonium]